MARVAAGVTRRTLVEWLGKGAVLALGAPLVEACAGLAGADAGRDGAFDGASRPDATDLADGGGLDGGLVPDGGKGFPFAPGDGAADIFRRWGERTVDEQDLASILRSWRLTVDGLVEAPRTFTFADLIGLPSQEQVTDFHCVEGWSIWDVPWTGVGLAGLLDLARPTAGATHVTFHTVLDAYGESLPLDVAREPHALLAYGIAGTTLPLQHGFPLRVVVPRLLGYKNAKYVYRLEVTDQPALGYWVRAGYPYEGLVPASRLRPGH